MHLWDISFVCTSQLPDRGFSSLAEKLSYTGLLMQLFLQELHTNFTTVNSP